MTQPNPPAASPGSPAAYSQAVGAVGSILETSVFSIAYPFIEEEVEQPADDPEANGWVKAKRWRPGTHGYGDGATEYADGIGKMILTVVSIHKPGRFPTRVFYTRQWQDPTGRTFGKNGLRMTTLGAFRTLLRGYRFPYSCEAKKAA